MARRLIVKWTIYALADLNRLAAFLRDIDPKRADDLSELLKEAAQSLSFMPMRGTQAGAARQLVISIGSARYVVRYLVYPERRLVRILRIFHGRESR